MFIPVTLILGRQGDTCTIQDKFHHDLYMTSIKPLQFTVAQKQVCHISQAYIYLHLLAKVIKFFLLPKQEFTNHIMWMNRELPWVTEHTRYDRNHFCNKLHSSSEIKHCQEPLPKATLQPSQHPERLYRHTHIQFKHSQDQEKKITNQKK